MKLNNNLKIFYGILILFIASAFILPAPLIKLETGELKNNPEPVSMFTFEESGFNGAILSPLNSSDFKTAVLEEATRILGWQNVKYSTARSKVTAYIDLRTNEDKKAKDLGTDNYLEIHMTIKEIDSPFQSDGSAFHGYPSRLGHPFQDWEIGLAWDMKGYSFYVYTAYGTHSGTPDPYPYGEALYQAFWNVTNGTTGGSTAPPSPQNPPADLCSAINCKNDYCNADGSKYLFNCTCDPADGKCKCSADTCTAGCDDFMGCLDQAAPADPCAGMVCMNNFCSEDGSQFLYDCGCYNGECSCRADSCTLGCDEAQGGCLLMQEASDPNDLCSHTVCGPDYCEDDQKTRVYNCKCDPADGQCTCYNEVCEAGCNTATGKCVESLILNDQNNGGGNYGDYDNSPDPLGILGVVAGGGLTIGAGFLGLKSILARRALTAATKAAASAAEPSLSELLDRASKSADRASKSIDQALKGTEADQQGYKEFVGRRIMNDEEWASKMGKRAALIEKAESGVRAIKKGADVTAELLGNVPGAGTTFKYTYNLSTTAAESIASGDSVGTVALKTTSKGLETAAGDVIFGKVTTMEYLPTRMSMRSLKIATRQVGVDNLVSEALKNEGTNNMMNMMKEVKSKTWFGKVEKGLEKADRKMDRKYIGKTIRKILYK